MKQKSLSVDFIKRLNSRVFLYSGLALLTLAFAVRWLATGVPSFYFWVLLSLAIVCKSVFLFIVLRSKEFKPALWLYLILAGVVLILASLLFKYVYPLPIVRFILFWGAIILKVSGLALMFVQRKA